MKVRHLLLAALTCTFCLYTPLALSADDFPFANIKSRGLLETDFPRLQKLDSGIYTYEGLHAPLPDGSIINTVSLIVVTENGVMVVDGQGDIWQTKLLIENIRKLTQQPIEYVVVASDHGDHVGGNDAFRAAYPNVTFVSSSVSQNKLSNTNNRSTQIVDTEHTIKMGETEIQIMNLGRAHTGGDLAVYLPESKVLFLGEIYLRGLFPAMRTAYPREWVGAIEKAQAMDVSWYIPGHGFIDDEASMKRDLEAARQSLVAVIAESERLHAAGLACESARECSAATNAVWGQYGQWTASEALTSVAINRVYQEIEGTLDPAQAVASRPGLIELWKSGQPAFGEYVTPRHKQGEENSQEPPPHYTAQMGRELAANPLLDYVFLNLEQHYDANSVRGALEGLRSGRGAAAKALLVRIPPIHQDGVEISRTRAEEALSLGANGVVLPHIRSAEEARTAVSFFEGHNVWSPANPEGDIVVMLLVEDPDVFTELEEIANIPGYSSLACGIGSLTHALGGDKETAEILNQQVLAHTKRVGMVDLITATEESMALRVRQGFLGLLPIGPNKNSAIQLGRAAAEN